MTDLEEFADHTKKRNIFKSERKSLKDPKEELTRLIFYKDYPRASA